jgi:hypothetical protein
MVVDEHSATALASRFFGSAYEIMYDAHAVIAWAMDRPKEYRAEFKFDERSIAPDRREETLTTSSLLETPSFSMEDLIRIFESVNVWEALKKKHDIHPERGDRILIPDFGRALFDPPKDIPDWVVQNPLVPKIHYYVIKGGR